MLQAIALYAATIALICTCAFICTIAIVYQRKKLEVFTEDQKHREQLEKEKLAHDKAQLDWCVSYLNEKQMHKADLEELYQVKCDLIALKEDYDELVKLASKTKLGKKGVHIEQ